MEFERELRKYFNGELYKIYYGGSTVNSAYRKIDTHEKKKAEFKKKDTAGAFVDGEHRERELKVVLESEKVAEAAQVQIEKMKNKADGPMKKIIHRIEGQRPKPAIAAAILHVNTDPTEELKLSRRTDKLSQYSRNERKLISKIFSIILNVTDNETAERIISRIEKALQ